MKKLFGLFIMLFMLLCVACGEVNTFVTSEHQNVGSSQYDDRFNFMKKIEHNNDRGARLYITITSQPSHVLTTVNCALISRNSIRDMRTYTYPEETDKFKTYIQDYVTNNVLTVAEQEWLLEEATTIESNRIIINPN